MADSENMPPEILAQEQCYLCPETVYGDTATEAKEAIHRHLQNSHGTEKIARTGGRPVRKHRWTISGDGAPLNRRADDWTLLCSVVERASELGLRVEIAEIVEEEEQ